MIFACNLKGELSHCKGDYAIPSAYAIRSVARIPRCDSIRDVPAEAVRPVKYARIPSTWAWRDASFRSGSLPEKMNTSGSVCAHSAGVAPFHPTARERNECAYGLYGRLRCLRHIGGHLGPMRAIPGRRLGVGPLLGAIFRCSLQRRSSRL